MAKKELIIKQEDLKVGNEKEVVVDNAEVVLELKAIAKKIEELAQDKNQKVAALKIGVAINLLS